MPETTTYRNALPLQSMLLEYRLESVLGAGGFGMTYLGWDTHLEKHVAIKEYLPTDLAVRALDGSIVPITTELQHDYQWGLERFILEARTLAKFSHPHIVRVNRYFEANGTSYMVMDYEKGESLNQMLKRGQQPDEAKLKSILMPLLDGLQAVHATGFLHRDIKPSNIFVRESGSPVLIDFGAARHAIGGVTRSLTSVLTPGYAPLEQYSSDGHQGPWSDIYAMAGVLYRALVNDSPPDAVSRMKGDTLPG
jgi:serine/threonine protein kinase